MELRTIAKLDQRMLVRYASFRGLGIKETVVQRTHLLAIFLVALILAMLNGCGSSPSSSSIKDAPTSNPQRLSSYWVAPPTGSVNSLGTVTVPSNDSGTVRLLSPTISGTGGSLVCTGSVWDSSGTTLTITYGLGTATVHVVVRVSATDTGVAAQLDADQPVITSVDMGDWDQSLSTKVIAVPYYTGNVWNAQSLSKYVNSWWDWHVTQATSLDGTSARYLAKTDGALNTLHEQMVVAFSSNVDDVLPSSGNAASPYLSTMSGRIVLDIWDAGFKQIERGFADLEDYGVANCVGIIHNWQHAGYDNALPAHYSANPDLGGSSGLQSAIAQGTAGGCLMALHENYVDYYPNYPLFTADAVALNSDASWTHSWFNSATGIQSFSTKPSWMMANAETQSPVIHKTYGTTADYLDVHSAVPISMHGDMNASSPGAGKLATWMQASKALWAYERQTHNGPVLGEGWAHWYYSGLLDGAEAQLGAGSVPINSGESLPLFVDFDLLKIHPLQVNHGMGYYERWTRSNTTGMTTAETDAYRIQEIAFGHAPFLSKGTWNDVSRAFVESNLVTPVATSYGTALATSIQYQVQGAWGNASAAAQTSQFDQVQVAYDNGLMLVANSRATPLAWNGLTIPQYGWAAKSANLLAYTAQCGSTICDYAQTPTSLFANARNQSDAEIGFGYAAPSVISVKQRSGRSFAITYGWQVYRAPGTQVDHSVFVHFVNDSQVSGTSDGIVFQGDYMPALPTGQWQPGQTVTDGPVMMTIPASVPDGTYSIRMGLYDPATEERLLLSGNNDGIGRHVVGYLTVSGGGSQLNFLAPAAPSSDPRLNAAGTVVDFPLVQTDGMVSISQQDGRWVLRPFPRYRSFTVLLSTAMFPPPSVVQAVGSINSTVIPLIKGGYWQLPLDGAHSYSWSVK